jgi:hypothetical protein
MDTTFRTISFVTVAAWPARFYTLCSERKPDASNSTEWCNKEMTCRCYSLQRYQMVENAAGAARCSRNVPIQWRAYIRRDNSNFEYLTEMKHLKTLLTRAKMSRFPISLIDTLFSRCYPFLSFYYCLCSNPQVFYYFTEGCFLSDTMNESYGPGFLYQHFCSHFTIQDHIWFYCYTVCM